jgi:hypothetical protein
MILMKMGTQAERRDGLSEGEPLVQKSKSLVAPAAG